MYSVYSFLMTKTITSSLVVLLSSIFLSTFQFQQATAQRFGSTVMEPVIRGDKRVVTQKFARLPLFGEKYPRIVSLQPFKNSLYVCTSVSGGLIYSITYTGKVSIFFNVSEAVETTGRFVDFNNGIHGGVRSIAFHPNFDKIGLFYVSLLENRNGQASTDFIYFSRDKWVRPADSVVIEFKADPLTMIPIMSSYRQVLRIGMKVYDHPIKQMQFSGRFLYISHGDSSVQNGSTGGGLGNDALGKILRINPLRRGEASYTIPKFNPYVKSGEYLVGIYAIGFRNPHNLCLGKDGTLYVVDAGRDNVEEVNVVKPGGNYGWPKREGPFVHRKVGGLLTGISKLPKNDKKNGFIYPAIAVGHRGPIGAAYVGQSLAGGCPIENGSPLDGTILYANFPTDGKIYYSFLKDVKNAVTEGNPSDLTRAPVYRAKLFYDPDGSGPKKPRGIRDLRSIVQIDEQFQRTERVDMRFGSGIYGEIFWTSKKNGWIYIITTSVPKSKLSIFSKIKIQN